MDIRGVKKKRTSKKNVDGRNASSHEKIFRTRSLEKHGGMAFGFRKAATAVNKNRIDRLISVRG
jgi:hypothetical protein